MMIMIIIQQLLYSMEILILYNIALRARSRRSLWLEMLGVMPNQCQGSAKVRPVRLLRVWISEGLTQANS